MTRSQNQTGPSPLNRGFWAMMGILHAPALGGAWRSCMDAGFSLELLGGCLVMTATTLFFALKLWGVAFLRFQTNARSWVALLLAVGLIHFDCISPALSDTDGANYAAVVISATVAVGLVEVWKAHNRTASRGDERRRFFSARTTGTVWLDAWRPHCWILASYLYRLRAPPA